MESYTKDIALIIPAYNPDSNLPTLLKGLVYKWDGPIIVVDDGSEDKSYFKSISREKIQLLRHYVNLGKGRALKTAMNYALIKYPDLIGFVQVDCDGKFCAKDVLNIGEKLFYNNDHLILGARDMDSENWPQELKWGNKVFTAVMNFTFDLEINDSQSGLRGIPRDYAAKCLDLPGDRYDYDATVLLSTKKHNINILEVPVETIFLEEDKQTHFKPLQETITMASAIIRFAASSGACSLLDLFLFSFFSTAVFKGEFSIIISTIVARIVSATLSFIINKNIVFDSDKNDLKTKEKFFILEVGLMIASAVFVFVLSYVIPLPSLVIKVFVDFLLWFANYYIQRTWVFV